MAIENPESVGFRTGYVTPQERVVRIKGELEDFFPEMFTTGERFLKGLDAKTMLRLTGLSLKIRTLANQALHQGREKTLEPVKVNHPLPESFMRHHASIRNRRRVAADFHFQRGVESYERELKSYWSSLPEKDRAELVSDMNSRYQDAVLIPERANFRLILGMGIAATAAALGGIAIYEYSKRHHYLKGDNRNSSS